MTPELERDFAARLVKGRPFAPWEVRSARAWKIPMAAAGGLLSVSFAVFLAPLWHLGPGTAVAVWGRVLAAALTTPLSSALAAGPLLADAASRLATQSPGLRTGSFAGLGLSLAAFLGLLLLGRRRFRATLDARAERP